MERDVMCHVRSQRRAEQTSDIPDCSQGLAPRPLVFHTFDIREGRCPDSCRSMPYPLMANHLRTAASWLRSSSLMASTLAAMPEFFQTYAQPFFTGDVPELLDLSAKVVATSPLPARLDGWAHLDAAQLLRAVPHAGTAVLLLSFALAALAAAIRMLVGVRRRRSSSPRTFWLTRVVLVRGMGLLYLAAFSTSAAQSRALFGSQGLTPALSQPSGRPSPAFDLVLGRTDLALEMASWLGVWLALLVLFGVVQWAALLGVLWLLYLSIVNLGARVVIGYGWEWATCEVGLWRVV